MAANQAQTWDNYRNNQRVVLQVPVHIAVGNSLRSLLFGGSRIEGRTSDVSVTGMLIMTQAALPQKAGIRLTVNMGIGENEGAVQLRGEVMWCRPDETGKEYRAGIRLYEKPRAEMKRWLAFVAERIRRFGGSG
jgi:c-di-GMP-binding flagellar brake protein YcgR